MGGFGYGVSIENSNQVVIKNINLANTDVVGGAGGGAGGNGGDWLPLEAGVGSNGGNGGNGGDVYGVHTVSSFGVSLFNIIANLTQGGLGHKR